MFTKFRGPGLFEFIFWAVVLYVAIGVSLFMMQRKFMYFPTHQVQRQATYNASDLETVIITTEDGIDLQAWYKVPETDKPIIVFFHGNGSHMGLSSLKMRDFIDLGYGVLLPAYRGYAGNKGKLGEDGFYKDARATLNWLIAQNQYDLTDIVVYGESLGTGIAVEMVSNDFKDVKGLVLESPYTSFIDLAKRSYFWLPLNILMRDKYMSIDKIDQVTAPLFIVNGTRDLIVPSRMGQTLFETATTERKSIKTISGAGHNDLYNHGAATHILHFISGL